MELTVSGSGAPVEFKARLGEIGRGVGMNEVWMRKISTSFGRTKTVMNNNMAQAR